MRLSKKIHVTFINLLKKRSLLKDVILNNLIFLLEKKLRNFLENEKGWKE